MTSSGKEIDTKYYKIVKKKNCHLSTKLNPNGTYSALQFSNADNSLNGPVELLPVEELPISQSSYSTFEEGRTISQIIWEDVLAPLAREAVYNALILGYNQLCLNAETYAMPKVRAVADTIGITVSGIKDGLSGKEPKAIRLLKEQKTNNSTSSVYPSPCQNKVPRSNEEINEIINLMHSSAFTLVACVRLLNNTAIADDGCNPNTRLDIQRNLQMLTAADITAQIELLLDKKNRSLLDESSLSLLESFRDGYFVSADKRIPISHFLD